MKILILAFLFFMTPDSWSSINARHKEALDQPWFNVFEGCLPVESASRAVFQLREHIEAQQLSDCEIFTSPLENDLGLHLSCLDGIGMFVNSESICQELNSSLRRSGL